MAVPRLSRVVREAQLPASLVQAREQTPVRPSAPGRSAMSMRSVPSRSTRLKVRVRMQFPNPTGQSTSSSQGMKSAMSPSGGRTVGSPEGVPEVSGMGVPEVSGMGVPEVSGMGV
ncbi:MAG: hypothetical protein EA398_08555, partial [Deltaproteobacteria bacterium]